MLNISYCVLHLLVDLKNLGVFTAPMIIKQGYWPKYIKGNEMDNYMTNREICDACIWQGVFDGVKVLYFIMKDLSFAIKIISTYGDTASADNQETMFCFYKDKMMRQYVVNLNARPYSLTIFYTATILGITIMTGTVCL